VLIAAIIGINIAVITLLVHGHQAVATCSLQTDPYRVAVRQLAGAAILRVTNVAVTKNTLTVRVRESAPTITIAVLIIG
jgi:hypothetical protein